MFALVVLLQLLIVPVFARFLLLYPLRYLGFFFIFYGVYFLASFPLRFTCPFFLLFCRIFDAVFYFG